MPPPVRPVYFFSFLRWFDLPSVALSAMALINPADVFRILVVERLNTGASGFTAALEGVNLSALVLVGTLFVWVVVPSPPPDSLEP